MAYKLTCTYHISIWVYLYIWLNVCICIYIYTQYTYMDHPVVDIRGNICFTMPDDNGTSVKQYKTVPKFAVNLWFKQ